MLTLRVSPSNTEALKEAVADSDVKTTRKGGVDATGRGAEVYLRHERSREPMRLNDGTISCIY